MENDRRKVFRRDRSKEGRDFDIIKGMVERRRAGRRISDFKTTVAVVREERGRDVTR